MAFNLPPLRSWMPPTTLGVNLDDPLPVKFYSDSNPSTYLEYRVMRGPEPEGPVRLHLDSQATETDTTDTIVLTGR